jgi:hypothetical protein
MRVRFPLGELSSPEIQVSSYMDPYKEVVSMLATLAAAIKRKWRQRHLASMTLLELQQELNEAEIDGDYQQMLADVIDVHGRKMYLELIGVLPPTRNRVAQPF